MFLSGASVVVIGGSSGMGLATAKLAAKEGAEVCIVGRDPDRLESAQAEIGGLVRAFSADAADEDALGAVFDQIDRVDHVASFAGEQPVAAVGETGHDLFQRAIDSRVWSAVLACRFAAPKMTEGGSFTFASGVSAYRARPNRSAGAVATAGLESFVRAMAVELAPIRVNALCPGAIRTPVLDRYFGERRDAAMEAFASKLPLGRVGEPEEIADAVLFLMRNGYVTGITLRVDGGALLV